jgi:PAS domain S-box-containing protein
MAPARKKEKKAAGTVMSTGSMRDAAERQLADAQGFVPAPGAVTPEALIHELQVHQVELEMQADELRRAQIALEEARDKYLDLYDFAPVGYLTLTDKAMVHEVNLTGARLLGTDRNKLTNTRFRRFVNPGDLDRWDRYFLTVLSQDTNLTTNLAIRRGDGSVFPARLEGIRLIASNGEPTVRIAFSDVTDIRRAEEALQLANKKLNLLSSITRHDILNHLIVLNGFLELLHIDVPDPALEHYFDRIMNASARIGTIIQFTRTYENIGVHAPSWYDARILVEMAIQKVDPEQVRLVNDIPPGTDVFADPLIDTVFYNLLDNAVRHGGKITTNRFSLLEWNDHLIIICEDDGVGIPAEEKERIFERGYGKNTGFGLYLAQEILSITGISIRETGTPGSGARFEIVVPKGVYRMKVRTEM